MSVTTVRRSWEKLYLVLGVLGMILPILDVWKCSNSKQQNWVIPPSISDSYYMGAIVPFVLILGSIGIVFFCNQGFNNNGKDKWCNWISGLMALGVISFPCQSLKKLFGVVPFKAIHFGSATVMFLIFSFMCLRVFTKVRSDYGWTKQKHSRNFIYYTCGITILLGMAFCIINIFWGEVIMLESFGIAYLVQGKIIFIDR